MVCTLPTEVEKGTLSLLQRAWELLAARGLASPPFRLKFLVGRRGFEDSPPPPPVVPASATSSALITLDSTLWCTGQALDKATFLSPFPYSYLWAEQVLWKGPVPRC